MQVGFRCPRCNEVSRVELNDSTAELACARGDWKREIRAEEVASGRPANCLVCGCRDLWRQKDFSQQLGLLLVGLGILLSTIAWAYTRPLLAIGILMVFALADLLLYVFMPDVLVCYRCGARYRHVDLGEHRGFDLETNERYRQEAIRLKQKAGTASEVTRSI